MDTYARRLNAVKDDYPFARWRQLYHEGLEQYTKENCDKAESIFDKLIAKLIALGPNAPEKKKVALFQQAIEATNDLDAEVIETEEGAELRALTDRITEACGLDPKDYGGGEGLASEWRKW